MFRWQGKEYTATELAKVTGIGRATILMRIDKYGWDLKKAVTTPAGSTSAKERLISFRGKTQSLTAWAKETGLSDRTIYERLRQGMTAEEALTKPRSPGRKKNPEKADR